MQSQKKWIAGYYPPALYIYTLGPAIAPSAGYTGFDMHLSRDFIEALTRPSCGS